MNILRDLFNMMIIMYHFNHHFVLRNKFLYLSEDFVGEIWSCISEGLCRCVNFVWFLRVLSNLLASTLCIFWSVIFLEQNVFRIQFLYYFWSPLTVLFNWNFSDYQKLNFCWSSKVSRQHLRSRVTSEIPPVIFQFSNQ